MKKSSKIEPADELRPEYDIKATLKNGVRGKYANRFKQGANLVLLEPDVAQAFPDAGAVNEALRLVMRLTQIQRSEEARPNR